MLQALQSGALTRVAQRLPGTLNDMAQFDAISPLPLTQIKTPILVIHGTGDRIVPFAHAQRIVDAAPNAELMPIENGEHVSLFTHLDAIRQRVRHFIARQMLVPYDDTKEQKPTRR